MKSSFFPKEVLAVALGILLIAGTTAITLFRTDTAKKARNLSTLSPEESELTRFFNNVSYIQPDTLQQETFNDTILVMDLRDEGMYNLNHIPKSVSATPDTAVALFQKQNPTPEKVILIDESGQTPNLKSAIEKLWTSGIKNVSVLSGGFGSWDTIAFQTVSWGDPDSIIDHSKVHAISVENARKVLDNKQILFVDFRSKEAFGKEHKPNSVNIPLAEVETLAKTLPPTKMLVVYGENPLESFQGGVHLFDLGYLLAYTLNGGYIDLK